MTEPVLNALVALVNTPPAWVMAVCMGGIYLTLWKAKDFKVRMTLLHGFLAGFLGALGFWGVDIATIRVAAFYGCF